VTAASSVPAITSGARLAWRARVLAQRAGDTLVLLDLDAGSYFSLDEVGARVWELCDGQREVAAIVDTLQREYEAPAETVAVDVLALLRELTHERLLVAAG
jgi:coenzyme PQQ biosynthesis protein PqqD